MALRADHAAGCRIDPRRPNDGAIAVRTIACAVAFDVCAAGTVAPLAGRSEVSPLGRIGLRSRLVVIVLLADVAPETVLVPLLDGGLIVFVGADDFHVVEPGPPLDVPAGREHDDAALFDRGQVMLNAAAAERVLDAVFPRTTGDVRLGDEVRAVVHSQLELMTAKR